jgi:hypothetical protein
VLPRGLTRVFSRTMGQQQSRPRSRWRCSTMTTGVSRGG